MSELRNRKGGADKDAKGTAQGGADKDAAAQEMVEQLRPLLEQPTRKLGTSNEAKKIKEQLAEDPMNMKLIFELGKAYAADNQLDRSANILLRGFKRVNEFEDSQARYEFLWILLEASINLKKYRQAYAVLNDMTAPDDEQGRKLHDIIKCRVYCFNGESDKALKAFNSSIEKLAFANILENYAAAYEALQTADVLTVAKASVQKRASTDEEKKKFEGVDKLMQMKLEYQEATSETGSNQALVYGVVAIFAILFLAFLWYLESKSLDKLKFAQSK